MHIKNYNDFNSFINELKSFNDLNFLIEESKNKIIGYHTSMKKFKTFQISLELVRNGWTEGKGIYFNDIAHYLRSNVTYGNFIYICELNIKSPVNLLHQLTTKELRLCGYYLRPKREIVLYDKMQAIGIKTHKEIPHAILLDTVDKPHEELLDLLNLSIPIKSPLITIKRVIQSPYFDGTDKIKKLGYDSVITYYSKKAKRIKNKKDLDYLYTQYTVFDLENIKILKTLKLN